MRPGRLPRSIARFAVKRPVWALLLGLGLCSLAALGALRVHIDTNVTSLLPHGHPALDRFRLLEEHLGAADLLALVIESPDPDDRRAAEALAREMAATMRSWTWSIDGREEPMLDGIQGVPDPTADQARLDHLVAHTWLFLDEADRDRAVQLLRPRRWPSNLANPSASIPAQLQDRDPLGIWTRVYLPWWQEQLDSGLPLERDGDYLLGPEGRNLILLCQAHHPAQDTEFTLALTPRVRELVAQATASHPEHPVHALGPYLLVERDLATVRSSAIITLVTSLVGVLGLFALTYRSIRLPALIALALLPATGAALGLAAIVLGGSLTMVVTGYAAILIGLGVDFVIHLYNGYLWAISRLTHRLPTRDVAQQRRWRAAAVMRAVDRVGGSIVAAALTSIGTFLILLAGHYRGLTELGAVCGMGLGLILVQLLLVVPAFLVLAGPQKARTSRLLAPLATSLMRSPRLWGGAVIAVLMVAGGYLLSQPELVVYDRNPRNLRPAHDTVFEEQIALGTRLGLLTSGHQVLIIGDQPDEVLAAGRSILQRARQHTQATSVDLQEDIDVAPLLAGGETSIRVTGLPERLDGRRTLATPLGELWFRKRSGDRLIGVSASQQHPPDPGRLAAGTTVTLLPLVARAKHPFGWFAGAADQRQNMAAFRQEVDWTGIDQTIADLDPELLQRRAPFFADLAVMRERLALDRPLLPGDLADSPLAPLLRRTWTDTGDQILLRLPLHLNHRTGQTGFAEALVALGMDGTGGWSQEGACQVGPCGPPSIGHVLLEILQRDFAELGILAALVTLVLLTLSMRRPTGILLAIASLGGGLVVALAVMHLLGMSWNLMNIAVLPLIFGIGVDNGIHFLHAARHGGYDRGNLHRVVVEIGHPILITAMTSIIGFGSLALNAYRGVQSLGITAAIGIAACLLVALIGLPVACLAVGRLQRRR